MFSYRSAATRRHGYLAILAWLRGLFAQPIEADEHVSAYEAREG